MKRYRTLIAFILILGTSGCGHGSADTSASPTPSFNAPILAIHTPLPTPVNIKPSPTEIPTPFVDPTPFPIVVTDPTPEPIVVTDPTPEPTVVPEKPNFVIDKSETPILTPDGLSLIVDSEVGGESYYKKHDYPEYPGGPSGVTIGIGYDLSTNSKNVIYFDWRRLGEDAAKRFVMVQPYHGPVAREHLKDVKDIAVPWQPSIDVFLEVDISRTDLVCERAFPGFENLRPHAQDAIRSLVFNRGAGMAGPNRTEMRHMRDYDVPNKDYQAMADDEIKMIRVWKGTDIYDGMVARRKAESKLFLTP